MEKKKVPALRFRGFHDDWEQCRFNEAFIERRDKTEKENEDILLSCAINGIFLNSELFSHFRGTTTIGYLKVKKNDLILSAQNLHLGNANVNLRFEYGIISPAYKVYNLNGCEPDFIQAWVKKDDTKNFFLAATTEGASQCRKNIEWETLGKQTIAMPTTKEQKEIGRYFKNLDHLITLHQRKYEKLQKLKKAMLEKLFPKPGCSVPEIRFQGFTDDWEQRKLSNVTEEFKSGTFIAADEIEENGEYPVYGGNGLRGYSDKYNHNGEFALIGRQGALCGNMNFSVGKAYFTEHAVAVKANGLSNTRFLYYLLDKMNLGQFSDQSAQPGLAVGKLIKLENMFPSKQEQDKIGGYFEILDNLITLHQRKLEKLKNLKKACLEKMFV